MSEDAQTASVLAPLRDALGRVERQVSTLERDRAEQFSQLGERLSHVTSTTDALRAQTASLAGSLNASTVRGTWGEVQLRRVLEHAGMLARVRLRRAGLGRAARTSAASGPTSSCGCPATSASWSTRSPRMTAFLAAQADQVGAAERERLLSAHATSLRSHVDALAAKAYWSAFTTTPEMVVCFVPGDSILAAAVSAEPGLFDHAMSRKVVLASPGTLLALLRTVAFTWQQDALTASARQLLELGNTLYSRLGSLGTHATKMGASLQKSVESYNALVGALESRVLVTARKMHDLGLVEAVIPEVQPIEQAPRPLTAAELLEALDADVARPQLDLDGEVGRAAPVTGPRRHTA